MSWLITHNQPPLVVQGGVCQTGHHNSGSGENHEEDEPQFGERVFLDTTPEATKAVAVVEPRVAMQDTSPIRKGEPEGQSSS